MKDPSDYHVRSVERALQILNCFDDEHPARGLSDIAQAVGLHKATAHRIVTTLLGYGYLARTPDGLAYRLGLQMAHQGSKVIRRLDVRREALPIMTRLVQEQGEACDLGLFDQGEVFYIEVIQGNHALTIAAAVGMRLPAHCTASGKVFLAHLPSHELEGFLSRPMPSYTERTITSPDMLRQQMVVVRRRGYAVDDEEYEAGIRAVAAPIRNRDGAVVAAMSVPGPTSRMTPERLTGIAAAVASAADAISRRLGWEPGG